MGHFSDADGVRHKHKCDDGGGGDDDDDETTRLQISTLFSGDIQNVCDCISSQKSLQSTSMSAVLKPTPGESQSVRALERRSVYAADQLSF